MSTTTTETEFVRLPQIGERFTEATQLRALPEGAQVRWEGATPPRIYVRSSTGWVSNDSRTHPARWAPARPDIYTLVDTPLCVGLPLSTREQFEQAPVGTVVWAGGGDRNNVWTKTNVNTWTYNTVTAVDDGSMDLEGRNVVAGLPASPPPVPARGPWSVGQRVRAVEDFEALPIGTVVIWNDRTIRREKRAEGWVNLVRPNDDAPNSGYMAHHSPYYIESVPAEIDDTLLDDLAAEPVMPDGSHVEVRPRIDTLRKFKQFTRTIASAHVAASGVSRPAFEAAMEGLNVRREELVLGMAWASGDPEIILPPGAMIVHGEPEDEDYFVIGIDSMSGHVRLINPNPRAIRQVVLRLEALPAAPVAEWISRGPRVDETQRILEFMRRLVDLGTKAKDNQGWCSEYERAVGRVGVPGPETGFSTDITASPVTPEECRALPVGSVVTVGYGEDQTILIRDDSMDNPTRTRRIGGRYPGDYGLHHLLHWPSDPLLLMPGSSKELRDVPVGTVIRDANNSRREKIDVDSWAALGTSADITASWYRYASFPTNN